VIRMFIFIIFHYEFLLHDNLGIMLGNSIPYCSIYSHLRDPNRLRLISCYNEHICGFAYAVLSPLRNLENLAFPCVFSSRGDEIVDAHRYMEENRSKGKLVVVIE